MESLVAADRIAGRCAELGREITRDYSGKDLILVGVLKGSVMFLSDLMRHIDLPLTVDYLRVSSYGDRTESGGVVRFELDLSQPVRGKHVLIVEDIVDTGLTVHYLLNNLATREPASLKVCTLLDKPSRRQKDVPIDYRGFQVPDTFVVGYGLDYQGRYRNLPYIGRVPAS
ncbi:MAG: hypoxanthine phosphoribosyltransferase [Planctomycetes bacterium]|nr:hypoxanthine phosphoribosyltransferase [Planctomycetota bacterium]